MEERPITYKSVNQDVLGTHSPPGPLYWKIVVALGIVFAVAMGANKIEIRRAVETQFKVKVAEVRIARQRGKVRRQGRYAGRQSDWKKAYVRLVPGMYQTLTSNLLS